MPYRLDYFINWRCYVAAFQSPSGMYVDRQVMEFCDKVIKKIREFCHENFMATLNSLGVLLLISSSLPHPLPRLDSVTCVFYSEEKISDTPQ